MSLPTQLSDYLVDQCARIVHGEAALRDRADVGLVHDTRVGIRRLRSTIRVFASLLAPGPAELLAFDDDLRRLAGSFGEVRDADVLARQVRRQVAELPSELVMGPIGEELDVALGQRRSVALEQWRQARSQAWYSVTLETLSAWQKHPPVVQSVTEQQLASEGRLLLRKVERKARRRLRNAGDDPVAVHRARKAIKRLRYTADLLGPVVARAASTRKRAKRLQSLLGRHQDLVVEIAFLREQAARFGGQDGHNGFTYGQLRAAAQAEAKRLRESVSW